MPEYWEGNLCNTLADVIVDSVLAAGIVCSHVPQLSRLHQRDNTKGLSPYMLLFQVFFSNAQLSEMIPILAAAYPDTSRPVIPQIVGGRLRGLRAFGAILGGIQVLLQWCCSVTVLTAFVQKDATSFLRNRTISSIAFLHFVIVVVPMVVIFLPERSEVSWGTEIPSALISFCNLAVAPTFVILQFFAQYRTMRNDQNHRPGALSLLAIGLQMVSMALLAVRWFQRIGIPPWGWRMWYSEFWCLQMWYTWAFPAINYVFYALGCAFLLLCHICNRKSGMGGSYDERAPLLG